MNGYTVKQIDEMASIFHGAVKLAGDELGVRSFGLQVIDLPAGFADYPEHDHASDGQEEVYVVLSGSVALSVGSEQVEAAPGTLVRVAPETKRNLMPGPEGVRILAIGRTVDGDYERPDDFRVAAGA